MMGEREGYDGRKGGEERRGGGGKRGMMCISYNVHNTTTMGQRLSLSPPAQTHHREKLLPFPNE